MKKETKSTIITEIKKLSILAIVVLVFFKMHYYKESITTLFKLVLLHFYLFIIPGYALMLFYVNKLDFLRRLVIGLGLGYGVQPLLLYLINVTLEINILRYNEIVSFVLILIGIFGLYLSKEI